MLLTFQVLYLLVLDGFSVLKSYSKNILKEFSGLQKGNLSSIKNIWSKFLK